MGKLRNTGELQFLFSVQNSTNVRLVHGTETSKLNDTLSSWKFIQIRMK
jgi:hypothetical protein